MTSPAVVARLRSGGVRPRTRIPAALRLGVTAQVAIGAMVSIGYLWLLATRGPGLAVAAGAMLALAVAIPPAGLAALALVLPVAEPELLAPPGIVALLVGATGLGILVRVPLRRPVVRVSPGMLFLAGYLVVSAVSLLPALTGYPAGQVSSATLEFIHLASGVGVFLLGVYLFRTVPVRPILRLLTVTAVLAALIAIAEFTGVGTLPSLLGGLGGTAGEGRAHSFFSNSNYFAFFSAQALVMLVELVAIERRARRATAAAAAVLVAIGLVLTLSRGGYLGGAVGLFVLLALRRPRAALALAGAAVLAVLVLYPVFLAFRLEISAGAADLGAYLDQQRSEHWRELAFGAGIQMFLGAPVFGIGFGMFQFLSPAYIGFSPATYSHNQWLDLLAEQGLVGMGFMLATLTGLVVALRRSTHALRLGALAMLAAYAVESLFINSLTSVQISGPLFLVLAAALSRGPAEGPAGERSWRFE